MAIGYGERPVHLVRFNPDPIARVKKMPEKKERESVLLSRMQAALASAPSDDSRFKNILTIEFLYYYDIPGSTLIAPLHRTSVQAYREVMRINLDSAVFMFQAWVTALQGGPGAAVMASSVVARIGVSNHEAIAAAKGGVEALVRSAAATYAAQGLRINAVAPGLTETPMTANMLKMTAMREGAARQYPLGGIQSAEQVADVMAFLLGDGAARLTGQVIAVDGGFTTVRPLVR